MNQRERALVETLKEPAKSIVFEAFKRFDESLDGHRFRLSLPGRHPCFRTRAQQHAIWMKGRQEVATLTGPVYHVRGKVRTYCDGFEKRSRHQSGLAVDIGFRDTWSGKFTWYVDGSAREPHELFRQLVAFLEEAGFEWAGRWKDPWDWHHFEIREDA